ncbi:ubiquitin carboxyl-terminal hydrolase 12-like [Papaver somniferum]|uniref:ubiquitin carboxyl-terminal hydrolase 12-like n=1 Tax=Papaver somniferum TaxID=3469 RepID=UPI000E6FBE72|nr:ubiquitin carboxyl-terminal hydrolase 12-like [Papaver somniferum]XP_026440460.1 ubiquitin carboxyl-terminal hydrolase 12-like [Papaver somniferum]
MTSEITNSHTSIKFDLKIHNFSNLGCKHKSDVFSVGNIKWRVKVYPKGDSRSWNHMAIYLIPDDKTKSPYAEFSFVIKSQTSSRNNEKGPVLQHQFSQGSKGHGWPKFITPDDLHDRSLGYLKHNTCIIQVKVKCRTRDAARG